MKNTIFFFTIAFLLSSCSRFTQEITLDSKVNLDTILSDYNLGKIPKNQGEIISGKILYYRTDDKFIIRAASHNYAFILQSNQIPIDFSKLENTGSRILNLHDQLIIVDASDNLIALINLDSSTNFLQKEITPPFSMTGFGLIKSNQINFNNIDTSSDLRAASVPRIPVDDIDEVSCSCEYEDSGVSCSSGGKNASSCSVSSGGDSCSVSCGGATYACCNS